MCVIFFYCSAFIGLLYLRALAWTRGNKTIGAWSKNTDFVDEILYFFWGTFIDGRKGSKKDSWNIL